MVAQQDRLKHLAKCGRLPHESEIRRVRTVDGPFVVVAEHVFTLDVVQVAVAGGFEFVVNLADAPRGFVRLRLCLAVTRKESA